MFVYIPGRLLYQLISYHSCQYWGKEKTICHLHNDKELGDYLCYLTIVFLLMSLLFKIAVWFFCKNLQLYEEVESKVREGVEIRELMEQQVPPTSEQTETPTDNNSKYIFIKKKLYNYCTLDCSNFKNRL